ncbi:transporter [Mesorhizobium sp. M2D.F.Ca.ET.185.01.1.1]|uniref:TolC family outer membrane protein n=1 Tax=unclassified Mesorhizobium TaxID=325217 RepID=UPI000FCC4A99|nr:MULTISPECIES: TolC family outer membrane protein [unclassified Mesorhizobium]TGP50430.1 transporter [bacterium M00.F.Ca.ET.230.01.1.1]TGP79276.1 transporter [bacterium M00.F.Ca.ET.227.01.1.1]TGQ00987.1 transporter [bacterium M00.F.Ca.ET.221.01.1.1]TGQ02494.1 transporter [bacterium M00.F.Ca.ET.222.01.1.1]TGT75533.1 transporter [bacterium M00.F.Ca.ET.159.01.1.1]TGT81596.1 transporter [bacterium M00.F.Ca.ET.157.01.1.1]TGU12392.1 transporter [bacterium M00.F.Ca.ET.163.01.1.1]TGU34361.1 trans
MPPRHKNVLAAILVSATALSPLAASAETITGALAKAYQYNSQLNSARAGVRVTDEGVAIAKSGYRPTVNGSGSIDYSSTRIQGATQNLTTGSFGIQINQMLFDGFQTKNNVAAAEAQVKASVESLRNTEENILFNAASAYMDVIRDRQVAALTEQNLQFLTEQARAARSRFEVGEGTRTDVAQADASRATAVAQLSAARATALASAATYHQIVGDEPGKLKAASPLGKLLPGNLDSALAVASAEHPAILSTQHLVDAAAFAVKSHEGALLPQLTASAGVSDNYSHSSPASISRPNGSSTSADIGATLTIPIYSGGRTEALVRQSKESLSEARIQVDVSRDQVRQAVVSAWTQYVAARESVDANRQVIDAAQLALNGVIEERNVGQRTTLDVLNAQNAVITAKINQASSERDVVVASYAILSAMGRLSVDRLGLPVTKYKPEEHYNAVKDKWTGLRTPDGR